MRSGGRLGLAARYRGGGMGTSSRQWMVAPLQARRKHPGHLAVRLRQERHGSVLSLQKPHLPLGRETTTRPPERSLG
jgi:hypothetical protein